MKKALIGIIGFFVILILIGVISGGVLWSHRNDAVKLDEDIKAQYTANQSNYDNMWKSFKEAAQVTDKQAAQFKEVYDGMISGRYQNDSNVLMKMVQEQNPTLGSEVYTKLQNLIIAGRREFDNNQKTLTDMVREYNVQVRTHPVMAFAFRYETKDASKMIVTSERTSNAFGTGKDDEINLNSK